MTKKMKISVCSDLHLEFADLDLHNTDNSDVLILSGDIMVVNDFAPLNFKDLPGFLSARSERYHGFFQRCSERWRHVVYVLGNHEHYHGDFPSTLRRAREGLEYLVNVHVLEKSAVTLDDVRFVGGTLWTDMNREDPLTLHSIRRYMNDFRVVEDSERPVSFRDQDGNFHERKGHFSPERSVEEHKSMLDVISRQSALGFRNLVVVGHHAPSRQSTHPRYKDDTMVNGAYSSELTGFILDRPHIRLWTHGHTHEPFDYLIGSTRVVCNPRGYDGHEQRADDFQLQTVEISVV